MNLVPAAEQAIKQGIPRIYREGEPTVRLAVYESPELGIYFDLGGDLFFSEDILAEDWRVV